MLKFNLLVEKFIGSCQTKESCDEFIEARKKGATKVQHQAQKKGGYSLLTAVHFKAKAKPYSECAKNSGDKEFAKIEAQKCLDKLKDWSSLTQNEFQKIMGQLEVYGEVYIASKDL